MEKIGDYIHGHCAIAHRRFDDPALFGRIDWEIQKTRLPDGRFTTDDKQWHALLHFGEHWWDRDAFYDSDNFKQWQREVAHLVEDGYSRKELNGLEAFFTEPDRVHQAPLWKMAFITWLGVWPTVLAVSSFGGR